MIFSDINNIFMWSLWQLCLDIYLFVFHYFPGAGEAAAVGRLRQLLQRRACNLHHITHLSTTNTDFLKKGFLLGVRVWRKIWFVSRQNRYGYHLGVFRTNNDCCAFWLESLVSSMKSSRQAVVKFLDWMAAYQCVDVPPCPVTTGQVICFLIRLDKGVLWTGMYAAQLITFIVIFDASNIVCHNHRLNDGYCDTRSLPESASQCRPRRATINWLQVLVISRDNDWLAPSFGMQSWMINGGSGPRLLQTKPMFQNQCQRRCDRLSREWNCVVVGGPWTSNRRLLLVSMSW